MLSPEKKGGKQGIKLFCRQFPVHNQKDGFLAYNLYIQQHTKGIESSIPFNNPCVRQACKTTCYFDSTALNWETLNSPCPFCGNPSQKVFLDVGFKNFLTQQHRCITNNRPLEVYIKPTNKDFYFTKMKNNFSGFIADYIGDRIQKEMAFDQIPVIAKKTLDFGAINRKLEQIFVPQYRKKDLLVYGFCKYHPQPTQDKDQNYLLLFCHQQVQPIKARLHNQQGSAFCQPKAYLESTKVSFLSELSTFIFSVSQPSGTFYYVSSLDIHFDYQQSTMRLVEMKEWQEPVGRFGGSLIADQLTNSFYVVGGYDYQQQTLSPFLIAYQQCRWYHLDDKYLFKGDRKIHQQSQARFNSIHRIGIKDSSFLVISDRGEEQMIETSADEKLLLSLGGSYKDFSLFRTGANKISQNNIRYLRLPESRSQYPVINAKRSQTFTFPYNNYILLQCPHLQAHRFKEKYRNHVLVLGGAITTQRRGKSVDKYSTDIYLVNIKEPSLSRVLQQQFYYGHLLSPNLDNFSSLLYDDSKGCYYIRATYPVREPVRSGSRCFLHYLIVEFELETEELRVIAGQMEEL